MTNYGISEQLAIISRRYWRLLMCAVIFGLAAGAILANVMTAVYRAEATVISNSAGDARDAGFLGSSQLGGLAALAGLNLGQADEKSEAFEYLQSRALARKFIEEHKLVPVFFRGRWDSERKIWRRYFWQRDPTLNDAVRQFRRSMFYVREDKRTGVLRISIEWGDRQRVAEWTNAYLRLANDELRLRAIQNAERSLVYLNRELDGTKVVDLRLGLFHLIEEQTKRVMLAKTREDYAFKVVDPAVAPDPEDAVRPQRTMITILFGAIAGLVALALLMLTRRNLSPSA